MTEGVEDENGIPVRDEDEEIKATIDLLKLARSVLGELPVYLVIGNDLGFFASKVITKLGEDGENDLFKVAIRNAVPDIKENRIKNNVFGKVCPFKADHDFILCTLGNKG
jgi:hypothetical protein